MSAGIPLSIVMVPLAWFIICMVYKPADVSQAEITGFVESFNTPKRMSAQEIKVVVIIGIMFILWIASSWISAINVMVVAILGCCVMFLPKIEVLDFDTFLRENSWYAFFLVGTVLSISTGMINNGVSDCLAALIPAVTVSAPVLIAGTALLIFVTLVITPVAASMIPIMAVPLAAIAVNGDLVLLETGSNHTELEVQRSAILALDEAGGAGKKRVRKYRSAGTK